MKQDPAGVALFVWEMLESILLQLDMRTLLISQRVCRHWYKVIRRSKAIQQALFFLPVETTDAYARVRNPLLKEIFWPRFINPRWEYADTEEFLRLDSRAKESFNRPSASWRQMLIQQPPTSIIGIVELFTHQGQSGKTHHEQILAKPRNDYLRMGAVYTALRRDVLQPCRETWVLSSKAPQSFQEKFLGEDRAPILDVALKECDIVVFIYHAAVLIRRAYVEKTGLELWLDELLLRSPRYKPKRWEALPADSTTDADTAKWPI